MSFYFGLGTDLPVSVATDIKLHLPAAKSHHYRNRFSMAELAKCWIAAHGQVPDSVAALVGSARLERAHFEYPVTVWGGGTSMTDLMAFLPDTVIAVEGKALESFDEEVSVWIEKEAGKNPRSPTHRKQVATRYAEALGVDLNALLRIRYQLLHRALAAAITAQKTGASKAWMIVQSFGPLDSVQHRQNKADFDRLLSLVGSAVTLNDVGVNLAWVDEWFTE